MARATYPRDFHAGYTYLIWTLDGQQQYPREHILTCLGKSGEDWAFNARPFAGTQTFSRHTKFVRVRNLGPSTVRDDPRHRMNKVIRDKSFATVR